MPHLLLVDDNNSVLVTLSIALRRHGHTVATALNAAQALALLRRERFDFLISDVRMPGMSGLELAAHARLLPHPPEIILTSAYANIEVREDLVAAFFRKPVDTEKLHQMLQNAPQRTFPMMPRSSEVIGGNEKNGVANSLSFSPNNPFKPA